ncbi:MAG: ribbon-helix-helix protein, CopG family [Opitutales bacterium]
MRTTLTLDPDLAEALKSRAAQTGRPYKQVVNEAIRSGLEVLEAAKPPTRRFKTRPRPMGLRPGLSYDKVTDLLAVAEGEDFA